MNEDELKHWGILDMHWGVRRYQNPDGSLTELGREHYGVGPARIGKGIEKIGEKIKKHHKETSERKRISKSNEALAKKVKRSPESLTDEELKNITYRTRNLANYYNAENDYLKAFSYNKELIKPKKKTNQFLNNVLVRPVESFLSKTVEFSLLAGVSAFLDSVDSKYAMDYYNFAMKQGKKNNKPNKQGGNPNKQNTYADRHYQNEDEDDDDD